MHLIHALKLSKHIKNKMSQSQHFSHFFLEFYILIYHIFYFLICNFAFCIQLFRAMCLIIIIYVYYLFATPNTPPILNKITSNYSKTFCFSCDIVYSINLFYIYLHLKLYTHINNSKRNE